MQIANVGSLQAQLADLERKSLQDNIWDDQSFAQSLMQQIANLREQIAEVKGLSSMLGEIDAAAEVASMEVSCHNHLRSFSTDKEKTCLLIDVIIKTCHSHFRGTKTAEALSWAQADINRGFISRVEENVCGIGENV